MKLKQKKNGEGGDENLNIKFIWPKRQECERKHIFYLIIIYRQMIFRNNLILRGPGKFSQVRIFDRKFIRHIVQDRL
jgi:hypothetical protein